VDGFGEHYLALYAHRNEREAELALALLARSGRLVAGQRLLDLACGAGRHLAGLGRRGQRAVGLDLSLPLLTAARGRLRPGLALVRGDMRQLPFRGGSFDGALSMFTSFGYFRDDAENWQVLAELVRVLRPGGWLFFDFLNRRQLEQGLVRHGRRQSETWVAEEERAIEGDRIVKRVTLSPRAGGGEALHYEESVRLFTPTELSAGLSALGFGECGRWGDYHGAPFSDATSPRLILLMERHGGPA
jgi:SAM-dependent methyltransferase